MKLERNLTPINNLATGKSSKSKERILRRRETRRSWRRVRAGSMKILRVIMKQKKKRSQETLVHREKSKVSKRISRSLASIITKIKRVE